MIYGNTKTQSQVLQTIKNVTNNKKWAFLIFGGPSQIGKTSFAIEIARDILWDYFLQDMLHIVDFGPKIQKKHILKIEYKETETSKILLKDYKYKDLGIREINERLSKSPVWQYKILIIENIDRLNVPSSNAFLKTCEEMNPNNIIIATTSNTKNLLETMISRAFLFRFESLTDDGMIDFIKNKLSDKIWNTDIQDILDIANGMPWLLFDILQKRDEEWFWLFDFISEFEKIEYGQKTQICHFFDKIHKKWFLDDFLNIIIYKKKHINNIQNFLNIRKNLNNSITDKNVFLNFAILYK